MRVSDNTSAAAVGDAMKSTRAKMEKLQIQNATQKKLLTPSDDPAANSKIMDVRTMAAVHGQFENNAALAKTRLALADNALEELYNVFVRAKEIAISQSSDASASPDSRLGVAQEVSAMYQQLLAIANRREGEYYLFGGYKTLTPPYTADGQYRGDNGEIPVEIQKDVFMPVNVTGPSVFEVKRYRADDAGRTSDALARPNPSDITPASRKPAAEGEDAAATDPTRPAKPMETVNIFHELDQLRSGLLTDDTVTIRDTMERLDAIIGNVITLRSKLSSRVSSIDAAIGSNSRTDTQNAELVSQLEDADYAQLWSDLAKEETVLRSSLHAAQKLIQPTLLEFLR